MKNQLKTNRWSFAALAAIAFFIMLALPIFSIAQSPGAGVPVRLELKPFPPPADGIVRCKSADELQIQLVGYEASGLETTLNQWRPTASSSNTSAATAEVPSHTGHQVRVKCIADGQTIITVAYKQVSTSLTLQVSDGAQTVPQSTTQTTQGISNYEIVKISKDFYADQEQTSVASCLQGKKVIGGGADVQRLTTGLGKPILISSMPLSDTGWSAKVIVYDAPAKAGPKFKLTVYAICASVQ